MTTPFQLATWEQRLLSLAHEALTSSLRSLGDPLDAAMLRAAYHYCDEITAAHSKTFFLATRLLPVEKRQATRALYAFCRVADNLVDHAESPRSARIALDDWRRVVAYPSPEMPVALAWADAQTRFNIPTGYAAQLIDGVGRDLVQNRYATFADLAAYAYAVASTVGLMAMHIIGFAGEAPLAPAVKLGVALQLTNILRDVGEDWVRGRVYLPQDELRMFGLRDADIAEGKVTPRWRAFMKYQIERTRGLYAESQAGIARLQRDGRFAVTAAASLYEGILDDIERADYDVFSRRAHLGTWGKLRRLPALWLRARFSGQGNQ